MRLEDCEEEGNKDSEIWGAPWILQTQGTQHVCVHLLTMSPPTKYGSPQDAMETEALSTSVISASCGAA
jgi:hypothetical protein